MKRTDHDRERCSHSAVLARRAALTPLADDAVTGPGLDDFAEFAERVVNSSRWRESLADANSINAVTHPDYEPMEPL